MRQVMPATSGLPQSNYTDAEATASQRRDDFLHSHMRALTFFGGVTRLWVPDNLKSWVTRACRFEPTLQHDYIELATFATAPRLVQLQSNVCAAVPSGPRRILSLP